LRRIIGGPRDEGDLGACALAVLELVLDVENSVTAANALLALAVLALGVEELLAEDRPVSLLGRLLDNDLLPVVADLVDNPLGVLAELELVEGADALGCDGNTGRVALAGDHGSDNVGEAVRAIMRVENLGGAATSVKDRVHERSYVPGLSLFAVC
jgi:hypothetical protein